jgi:PhoD-like phosphatase, N-terminal domain
VIWTRLAPDPLADDGFGGMPARAVDVEREVAADEKFTRVEQRGITTAAPGFAHSVHVELTGLRPADGGDIRDARSCGGVARDVSTADVSTGLQCGTARSWFRLGCPDRNLLHCRSWCRCPRRQRPRRCRHVPGDAVEAVEIGEADRPDDRLLTRTGRMVSGPRSALGHATPLENDCACDTTLAIVRAGSLVDTKGCGDSGEVDATSADSPVPGLAIKDQWARARGGRRVAAGSIASRGANVVVDSGGSGQRSRWRPLAAARTDIRCGAVAQLPRTRRGD